MPKLPGAVLLALLALPLVAATIGCGEDSAAPPAAVCVPLPLPAGIPTGWEEYTDWSCDHRLYVPGSREVLPKPIVWEPCPGSLGDDCRSMVADWGERVGFNVGGPTFDVLPDGTSLLAFSRTEDAGSAMSRNVYMVAEVDGNVRTAMAEMSQVVPGRFVSGSIGGGKRVLGVNGHAAQGPAGLLGGTVDDLRPHVVARHTDGPYGWWCNEKHIVGFREPLREFITFPWSGKPTTKVSSVWHASTTVQMVGDAIFLSQVDFVGKGFDAQGGIDVFTPSTGEKPFIRSAGDPAQIASNFGTDGADMAWVEGEPLGDAKLSLMTAKFTTDPSALEPRRLRSASVGVFGDLFPIGVGCGYAATSNSSTEHPSDMIVVRQSDGWSWTVPGSDERKPNRAIGLTCKEAFFTGQYGGHAGIARVTLDSLGPGQTPD